MQQSGDVLVEDRLNPASFSTTALKSMVFTHWLYMVKYPIICVLQGPKGNQGD